MRTRECEHEARVAQAVRSGEWEDSLRRHVSECPSCHELATVAEWMRILARNWDADSPLPGAAQVRLRARLEQEAAEQRGEIWPSSVIQGLGGGLLAFVSTAWIVANWATVYASLARALQSASLTWILERELIPQSLLSLSMILAALVATLAIYPILSED